MSINKPTQKPEHITLSLLDRLKPPPKNVPDWARDKVQELTASVAQDLQNLLNTHKVIGAEELPDDFPELRPSLVDYGIPDLTTISIYSDEQKQRFTEAVQRAIEVYEPRLKDVRVELLEANNEVELIFRFRIKAVLIVEPKPIPISFDTPLFSDTRLFAVKAEE